jgi:nucleoside-diphosphate-sugar epimerase
MKVLITGAAGYVGSNLCKTLLNRGYAVKAMDNFSKGHADALIPLMTHPLFEFVYGDVSVLNDCKKAIEDVDGVIHLASLVGFPACKRQPGLSELVTVKGTENMTNVNTYRLPFVFASTGSVYGKVEDICKEESPKNPLSEYGIHKLAAEEIVTSTPNTISLRFATGYGVSPCMRVNLLVNDLVYQAVKNRTLTIFEADARRTFIHVKDMAKAFILGLETLVNELPHEKVYNAGSSDSNMTKRELAEHIKAKTGCHIFYGNTGKDIDQRDYEVDYSKFATLGYTPDYTMEQGIDELIKVAPILQGVHRYE